MLLVLKLHNKRLSTHYALKGGVKPYKVLDVYVQVVYDINISSCKRFNMIGSVVCIEKSYNTIIH